MPPVAAARPSALRQRLTIVAIVGTAVSVGHQVAPGAPWWSAVHALLPAAVFSFGAWSSGHRALSLGLVLRGAATVAAVAVAFTAINDHWETSPWLRVALNYAVPFVVSTLGAMRGTSRWTRA